MTVDWGPLRAEFRLWRAAGLLLPFWWRDDDAVAPTEALTVLAELSARAGVPVHLAIVPRHASKALADSLAPCFVPVVHGWAHQSHSPEGVKKAEFGEGRLAATAREDLACAMKRMRHFFGARLAPMFVPPWNRIDAALLPELAGLGYDAVSTYLPRKAALAAPGVQQINTHVDPIAWRVSRGLVAPDELIGRLTDLLRARRVGVADNLEPFGYLTHHLVHDAEIWEFSRQFLQEMGDGPVMLYRHDGKDIS